MLVKICKIPEGAEFPPVVTNAAGESSVELPVIGELVKVPEHLHEFCEGVVGEFSMSYLPLGIEVHVDGDFDGLWVQREIYEAAKKHEHESNSAVAN